MLGMRTKAPASAHGAMVSDLAARLSDGIAQAMYGAPYVALVRVAPSAAAIVERLAHATARQVPTDYWACRLDRIVAAARRAAGGAEEDEEDEAYREALRTRPRNGYYLRDQKRHMALGWLDAARVERAVQRVSFVDDAGVLHVVPDALRAAVVRWVGDGLWLDATPAQSRMARAIAGDEAWRWIVQRGWVLEEGAGDE
jgi:hypothetical protein